MSQQAHVTKTTRVFRGLMDQLSLVLGRPQTLSGRPLVVRYDGGDFAEALEAHFASGSANPGDGVVSVGFAEAISELASAAGPPVNLVYPVRIICAVEMDFGSYLERAEYLDGLQDRVLDGLKFDNWPEKQDPDTGRLNTPGEYAAGIARIELQAVISDNIERWQGRIITLAVTLRNPQ